MPIATDARERYLRSIKDYLAYKRALKKHSTMPWTGDQLADLKHWEAELAAIEAGGILPELPPPPDPTDPFYSLPHPEYANWRKELLDAVEHRHLTPYQLAGEIAKGIDTFPEFETHLRAEMKDLVARGDSWLPGLESAIQERWYDA